MPEIVWLDDVREGDRARVGSKAFHLARLRQAGFAVPDGFVLPDGPAVDREALREALERLPGPVAVRSSSAAEDTADASFAGQYHTELAVVGEAAVVEAIGRCRASTAEAAAYADTLGAGGARPPAVLVQRFVEPRVAGVVFTRHPRDPGALLVEAHAGRGEALVSGAVTPDRWVLDRDTRAVREGPADGPLDASDLEALAGLALRAEALLGGAQDVEWAKGPDGLVLLQARPITVEAEEARDPRVRRLTRANVGEVLPDPVSPLTATTVMALLEHAFRTVATRAGLDGGDGAPFLVLHHERVYLNLARALDVAARLPGVTHEDAERLVLGGGAGAPPPAPGPRAWPRLAWVGGHLLGLAYVLDREVAEAEAALARVRAHREAPDEALPAALDAVMEAGRTIATTHILVSGASAVRLALLTRLVAGACPGDPVARVNRLMGGLEGVESAEPAVALAALAAEVTEDRAARALLARGPGHAAARIPARRAAGRGAGGPHRLPRSLRPPRALGGRDRRALVARGSAPRLRRPGRAGGGGHPLGSTAPRGRGGAPRRGGGRPLPGGGPAARPPRPRDGRRPGGRARP